jgi:hypothetical protein
VNAPGRSGWPVLEVAVVAAMIVAVGGVLFFLYAGERRQGYDSAATLDLLHGAAAAQAYAAKNDGRYGGLGLEPFAAGTLRRSYGWEPQAAVEGVYGRGEDFEIVVRSRSGRLVSYDSSDSKSPVA